MIESFTVLWCHRGFMPDTNIRCWSLTCLWALRSPALLQWVCTVSWLRSYEFGQSEECEPLHGPRQASERESSLKLRPRGGMNLRPMNGWMWRSEAAPGVSSSHRQVHNKTIYFVSFKTKFPPHEPPLSFLFSIISLCADVKFAVFLMHAFFFYAPGYQKKSLKTVRQLSSR